MRLGRSLFVPAVVLCMVRVQAAAQTVYGQGGLLLHPSAFVRPTGSVNLGVSYFTQETSPSGRTEWNPFSLSVGLTPAVEAGVTVLRRTGGGPSRLDTGPFLRCQLLDDEPDRPALGLVFSNLPSDLRQLTLTGVLSHRFGAEGRGPVAHAGAQWVQSGASRGGRADVGLFCGVQIPLSRSVSLVAEAGTKLKFERRAASALGLMWNSPGGGSVAVGWVNTGRSRSHGFFIGAGYPLGGAK